MEIMRVGKIIGQGLLVLGALAMVGISVVRVRAEGEVKASLKQRVEEVSDKDSVGDEKTAIVSEEINYYLPYPGILPDHPLYWMKMIRDKAVEWTILDVRSKADYWVFLADKRMGAGTVLIDGNKAKLGVDTYWKASKYLQKAVKVEEDLKKNKTEVGSSANKIEQATLKYLQTLDRSAEKNEKVRGEISEIKKEVEDSRSRILKVLGRE